MVTNLRRVQNFGVQNKIINFTRTLPNSINNFSTLAYYTDYLNEYKWSLEPLLVSFPIVLYAKF